MSVGAPPSCSAVTHLHLPMDDRDLDDAELWAVIDSAAASLSSRPRKSLIALKSLNTFSYSPNAHQSPAPTKPYLNPRIHRPPAEEEARVPVDGEVVQEERWVQNRPQKTPRLGDHGLDSRMVVFRHPSSESACASPNPGRFPLKEASPVVESPSPPDHRRGEEKDNLVHSLSGQFPSVSLFKQYQNAAMGILEKTDYTMISGSPFIKKSGWRKISFFFNVSFEIKDKDIEFDENRNVQRAEFVVRASMQGGRFSDGWGSCERREKRFQKPNHDIPSTAETRAKNKACQDLLGIGEYRPGVINGHR